MENRTLTQNRGRFRGAGQRADTGCTFGRPLGAYRLRPDVTQVLLAKWWWVVWRCVRGRNCRQRSGSFRRARKIYGRVGPGRHLTPGLFIGLAYLSTFGWSHRALRQSESGWQCRSFARCETGGRRWALRQVDSRWQCRPFAPSETGGRRRTLRQGDPGWQCRPFARCETGGRRGSRPIRRRHRCSRRCVGAEGGSDRE
jgi:hypothetical protein